MSILTITLYLYSLGSFIGAYALIFMRKKPSEDSSSGTQRFIIISLLSLIAALLSEPA